MASSPDPGNCLVPEEEEIQGAIERLTSTEKDIINEVLLRDEEIRSQEKQRLRDLKREYDELVELGVPEGKEKEYGRCCVRCRSPLGLLSNKGALCPWCKKKVCKNCEKPLGEGWICTLCFKDREIKGETGEWFYGSLAKKKKTPYGSTLLKKLIKRRKSQAYKLSKSRRRSEEESFEIEYAIADTFRKSAAEKSDQEYVVVNKEADGNISVSEGKVNYVDQFGSEAAALDSVIEESEREAALNDVAFTGASLNGFDSNRNEAGDEQLFETNAVVHITASKDVENGEDSTAQRKPVKLSVVDNPFLDELEISDDHTTGENTSAQEQVKKRTENRTESQRLDVPDPAMDDDEIAMETGESPGNDTLREISVADTAVLPMPPKPARGVRRSFEDLTLEYPDLDSEEDAPEVDVDVELPGVGTKDEGSPGFSVKERVIEIETYVETRVFGKREESIDIVKDIPIGLPENVKELPSNEEEPTSAGVEPPAVDAVSSLANQEMATANEGSHQEDMKSFEVFRESPKAVVEIADDSRDIKLESPNSVKESCDIDVESRDTDVESRVVDVASPNPESPVVVEADEMNVADVGGRTEPTEDVQTKEANEKELGSMEVTLEIYCPSLSSAEDSLDNVFETDSSFEQLIDESNDEHEHETDIQNEADNGYDQHEYEADIQLEACVSEKEAKSLAVQACSFENTGSFEHLADVHKGSRHPPEPSPPYDEDISEKRAETRLSHAEVHVAVPKLESDVEDLTDHFEVEINKNVVIQGEISRSEGKVENDVGIGEVNENVINEGADFLARNIPEVNVEEVLLRDDFVNTDDLNLNLNLEESVETLNEHVEQDKEEPNDVCVKDAETYAVDVCSEIWHTEDSSAAVEDDQLEDIASHSKLNESVAQPDDECTDQVKDFPDNISEDVASQEEDQDEIQGGETEIDDNDDAASTDIELEKKAGIDVKEKELEMHIEQGDDQINKQEDQGVLEREPASGEIGENDKLPEIEISVLVDSQAKNQETDEVSYDFEVAHANGQITTSEGKGENLEVDVNSVFEEYEKEENLKDQIPAESYESLGSIHSNTDVYEALRPQVKVAGEILLGFKYDEAKQHFEVQIHKAKGLVAADTRKNTSDPYVKTYLLQDKTRSNKKKTKVKKHTLDPVFDDILVHKISYEDLIQKTLSVSVWHNDMLGQNVFLGEVQIVIQEYIASGYSLSDPLPQLYQLAEKRVTRESLKNVGDIVLEIMYIPPGSGEPQKKMKTNSDPVSGKLLVKCIEGKNLTGTESSNPFCKLILLPMKSKSKEPQFKTEVEARTLNPYWDQELIFENVTFNELSSKVLQVSVHDASVGSKDNFMGAVRLGSGTSEEPFDDPDIKESIAWQKMLQEPNKRISSTLSLRSTLESLKSCASLAPVLVEREEDTKYQRKKSDSILSQTSTASNEETSSIKTASLPFKGRLKPQPDLYSLQSFGSMLSIYSDAGGYGSVPISGEMLFSIQYDNMSGVFEIHVQKAKNIAAVNKKTRASDPYVKTYLLPDKSKDSKKKTNFKRKTVNPNWDEKIKYKIGEKDLMKRTLQVSIWNHEKFGHNDFLGEVQVQIAQYVKSGHNLNSHEPIWYTLQELAPVSVGAPGYKGAITVGLKYERIDDVIGKLLVDVKEARDLAAADPNQLSNPFVKSYLLPDRTRKSKRKSTFKKGTLSPQWNEKFEYNGVTLEELEQRVLELTVWDHDLHSNDFLGGARLGLERGDENWHDCIGKEASIWNAMLEHPGIWVEYSIPLRDSMTSRKGMDLNPPNVEMETAAEPEPEPVPEPEPEPAPAPRVIQHQPDAPVTKTGDGVSSAFNISYEDPLVRLGLMYVSPEETSKKKGSLKVFVKGARNLPSSTGKESPSTYCKCYIRPKRISGRLRTDVFKRSTEPAWEKEFEFDGITMEELSTKCLDVIVCDDSNFGIGMVRLGSGLMQAAWDDSTDREIEIWKAMMENPDSWNNLTIPLRMEIDETSTTYTGYEDREEDDMPVEVAVVQASAKPQEKEPLSAKELALQAMGSHATKIKDIMRTNGATDDSNTNSGMKARTRSQDDLLRPLSLIVEEGDGEENPRVRFEGDKVGSAKPVPRVVVTKDNEMPPQFIPDDAEVDIGEADFPSNLTKMSKFGSRDSIVSQTSIYSTTSNSVFGAIPVRGEVQFGMKYIMGTNTFEVHIFRAKEIAAVDARKNTSDPYVKVYMLPDKTKASKKKTKVKHKTLNPEWNDIIEYKISFTDLRIRTLMVSVWNNDRFGKNYFLGEVILPLDKVVDDGILSKPNTAWYRLQEKSHLSSPIVYKGELTIGLMYEDFSAHDGTEARKSGKNKKDKKPKKDKKKGGRIHVHVIKANDLPAGDDDGFCDPFCKFYLLPLKQAKTKRKTPVIKKARAAYWDYKTEYDADYDDLPDLGIEFTVYDWDQKSRNDFLGCCRLNLGGQNANWDDAHGVERDAWLKMINEPNKLHEFVIPMRSSSDPRPRADY